MIVNLFIVRLFRLYVSSVKTNEGFVVGIDIPKGFIVQPPNKRSWDSDGDSGGDGGGGWELLLEQSYKEVLESLSILELKIMRKYYDQ